MKKTETNIPIETVFQSAESYTNPFMDVELDVEFVDPQGKTLRVPGFWKGGNEWAVRYASTLTGNHTYKTICNTEDSGLNGIEGEVEITPYTDDNPLYKHGPIGISEDQRHFEHHDGTPFLWLADTWWKGLSKRLTWEGFQELCEDRSKKGFNAVQIVCGPYPDEIPFSEGWDNEGGTMYAD